MLLECYKKVFSNFNKKIIIHGTSPYLYCYGTKAIVGNICKSYLIKKNKHLPAKGSLSPKNCLNVSCGSNDEKLKLPLNPEKLLLLPPIPPLSPSSPY